jgi:two-component system sensor histidine kinase PilS (NtrC family)
MTNSGDLHFGYQRRSNNWTSLRLINVYRLGLASIFFSQAFIQKSPLLNIIDLSLYAWTSFAYLLLALTMMLWSWIDRRNFQIQVSVQVYFDIIAIIFLMHACGGISTGLGMLLVISIAVIGLIGEESMATVFASLASVGLLAEFYYASTQTFFHGGTSTQVGLLGASLFATALVTQTLTQRVQKSEAVIRQKEIDVANLSALNFEIIQNMQSGVIALDREDQVRHINDIARDMLGQLHPKNLAMKAVPFALEETFPDIFLELDRWRHSDTPTTQLLTTGKSGFGIQVSFHDLSSMSHRGTLVFLDNISKLKQQMQQSKLASLGHLTANIAHEIRNPLGAITHAAQLLAESPKLAETDHRLTEIIQHHSSRINAIIEDIQQLSKGRKADKDRVKIRQWLENFVDYYCQTDEIGHNRFELQIDTQSDWISFDTGHLNRILVNLCNNARTHSGIDSAIHIKVYDDREDTTCIEVADQGLGIDEKTIDKIFEPFYTTSTTGTGLGLFIVDQLCDMNGASISVDRNEFGGASFIIHLAKEPGVSVGESAVPAL